MKKILFLLLAAGLFTACSDQATETDTAGETSDATTEEVADASSEEAGDTGMPGDDETGNYGAEISAEGAITAADVPGQLDGQDSVFVKVKGAVNACCQKKGCWMTVAMNDEEDLMVRFKDYGFFVPKGASGKDAIMEGWAYREEISVDELRHYAEDEGKSEEEINAITEPETRYTFLADGVIIAAAEGGDAE